jgi:two-component system OmpR family response regulator
MSMRVLVVEDEITLADSLARGLRADGFDVDVAYDGHDGLWRAREHPYAVIVLDLLLPGVNGYRICAALRGEENWTPILMLTAKDGEYDEAEALDSGADDFLSKPFSFVVLTARLRALARRGNAPRPPVLSHGRLVLDPGARRCRLDAEEISLTPRQFSLLEALMRRGGDVVSKYELLDEVWGADLCDPNVVEVYVGYLRRKVGADVIETVRGIGYRVVSNA